MASFNASNLPLYRVHSRAQTTTRASNETFPMLQQPAYLPYMHAPPVALPSSADAGAMLARPDAHLPMAITHSPAAVYGMHHFDETTLVGGRLSMPRGIVLPFARRSESPRLQDAPGCHTLPPGIVGRLARAERCTFNGNVSLDPPPSLAGYYPGIQASASLLPMASPTFSSSYSPALLEWGSPRPAYRTETFPERNVLQSTLDATRILMNQTSSVDARPAAKSSNEIFSDINASSKRLKRAVENEEDASPSNVSDITVQTVLAILPNLAALDGDKRLNIDFHSFGVGGAIPQTFGRERWILPDGLTGSHRAYEQEWTFELKHNAPLVLEAKLGLVPVTWRITHVESGEVTEHIESTEEAVKRVSLGWTVATRVFLEAMTKLASRLQNTLKTESEARKKLTLQKAIAQVSVKKFTQGPLMFGLKHRCVQAQHQALLYTNMPSN